MYITYLNIISMNKGFVFTFLIATALLVGLATFLGFDSVGEKPIEPPVNPLEKPLNALWDWMKQDNKDDKRFV